MAGGGHVCGGGMYVAGVHVWSGCVWLGACMQERQPQKWAVRILKECILV